MARRKTEKPAEVPPETEAPVENWGENPDQEAAEGDQEDEANDGEGQEDGTEDEGDHEAGNGESDPEADLAAVSHKVYDDPPEAAFLDEAGDGIALGAALTERQVQGIDPLNAERTSAQATERGRLGNAQTDHERDNALDPVSGTANPGITENHGHSAPGSLGASDMSGRKPFADPLASAGPQVRAVMDKLGEASTKARQAGKRGHGFVTLRDLGVHKSIMDALVSGGHVVQETATGGAFNPETGTVYRVASHVEP